jgi:hypothetical protein
MGYRRPAVVQTLSSIGPANAIYRQAAPWLSTPKKPNCMLSGLFLTLAAMREQLRSMS